MAQLSYILWTCANLQEAQRIIHDLLQRRLIACASILPDVTSIYTWQGKIETAQEAKVILKTEAQKFDAVCTLIREQASYEISEISQINTVNCNPQYLEWVVQETLV